MMPMISSGEGMVRNGPVAPSFLYGTAWKEQDTQVLTRLALESGFRGIDTANQRKHYFETGAGAGIHEFLEHGEVERDDLFIQTKFTYPRGQDHRIPYDVKADSKTQVQQSFNSSLEHLGIEHLASYLLHGPQSHSGISNIDKEVWRGMEELHGADLVTHLGISNVGLGQLQMLCAEALVMPAFVQNRCYSQRGWDLDVRRFCQEQNITYQGFSLLTANAHVLADKRLQKIADEHAATTAQTIFRFSQQLGMLPLTGTSDERHMLQDLACDEFTLSDEQLLAIETMALS